MSPQDRILISYGILAVIVIAIFVSVALSSLGPARDYAVVQPRGYAIRRVWFWVLLGASVVGFAVTIPSFPYSTGRVPGEATHFAVIARQYTFTDLPQVVPYDTPVVFDVTAADVNHGFAIYDPDNDLVGQVQAMPDYVNHLRLTFTERGRYTVLCLEYCGINHHNMRGSFEVR